MADAAAIPTVPESHLDLVNAPTTVIFSTLNADESIQSTAVWSLVDDDGLVRLSLQTDRQKYLNLVRHPHATIFSLDPTNPYRGIEIRGTVELSRDDEARTFTRRIIASYGNDPASMQELLDADRVIVTLTPTRINVSG